MVRKSAALRNVAKVLSPDGLFFGSTVLGDSGNHSWAARRMLALYNGRGSFDNRLDSEANLREVLEGSFEHVELDVVGSIAIFFAMGSRSGSSAGTSQPPADAALPPEGA
jgi:hypothetical protein